MAKVTQGTAQTQILPPNPMRTGFEIEFPPVSVEAGNTGIMYLSVGNPPGSSSSSNSYDTTLVPGTTHSRRLKDGYSREEVQGAVWVRAENADQVIFIRESLGDEQ